MGSKGNQGKKNSSNQRTRINPKTGQVEQVSGTKAGKKRLRLPEGDPLRTHDLHEKKFTSKKKKKFVPDPDED